MNSDFKVRFGGKGRTLLYEDTDGTFLFEFDVAWPDGKKIIIDKTNLTGDFKPLPAKLSEADQARIQLAFERVKQYVTSCGYELYVP